MNNQNYNYEKSILELTAQLNGLVCLLKAKGLVSSDEVESATNEVRNAFLKDKLKEVNFMIRLDTIKASGTVTEEDEQWLRENGEGLGTADQVEELISTLKLRQTLSTCGLDNLGELN